MASTATLRDTVRGGLEAPRNDFWTTAILGYPMTMGRIVAMKQGKPVVDYPGNEGGPRPALTTVEPPAGANLENLRSADVLLVFTGPDQEQPIIVGFPRSTFQSIDQSATPATSPADTPPTPPQVTPADSKTSSPGPSGSSAPVHVEVDGKRVTIQADQEIRLCCGRSSITMRKDGKIVIQGTHLVSRAEGVNRIKGGSVKVN